MYSLIHSFNMIILDLIFIDDINDQLSDPHTVDYEDVAEGNRPSYNVKLPYPILFIIIIYTFSITVQSPTADRF